MIGLLMAGRKFGEPNLDIGSRPLIMLLISHVIILIVHSILVVVCDKIEGISFVISRQATLDHNFW